MPKQDKRVGTTIAGYYVEEMIGWGATSKVYRGSHTLTKQRVAIKVLNKPRSRIGYDDDDDHIDLLECF